MVEQHPDSIFPDGFTESLTEPSFLKSYVGLAANGAIYFGYAFDHEVKDLDLSKAVTLHDARFLLMISPLNRGWVDLAVKGPDRQSRVSPAGRCGKFMLIAIMECTKAAGQEWEKEHWSMLQPTQGMPVDQFRGLS